MGFTNLKEFAKKAHEDGVHQKSHDMSDAPYEEPNVVPLFAKRSSVQSFMNVHEKLVNFFLSADSYLARTHPNQNLASLYSCSTYAQKLAEKAAMACTGQTYAGVAEIKLFYPIVTSMLVDSIYSQEDINEENLIALLKQVAEAANPDIDTSFFKDMSVHEKSTVAMRASSIAMSLYYTVTTYNFRQDTTYICNLLSNDIFNKAQECAGQMTDVFADEDVNNENRIMLAGSFSQKITTLMKSSYIDTVRHALGEMTGLTEEEKKTHLADNDYISAIREDFNKRSKQFIDIVISAYKNNNMNPPLKEESINLDKNIR